ncbi:MAG TPA: 23S rRNA (guanosine(2251)-2'-O)-methyltransferase RlmB [Acidimicrobiales bacterium]|nr:23S rRNA (guanosine(2251)-2'-O)-methyltransferase RlmB [Acidimicrobiales bacterium]
MSPPPPRRRKPPAGGRRPVPPRKGAPAGRPPGRASSRELGGEQVEGRQAVRELLAARRRRVHELVLAEGLDPAPVLAEILDLAGAARVPVRLVGRGRLDALAATDAPQGVLARAEPLPEADIDELVEPAGGRPPFLLALDGVTDPHNLGALLRTAECAGVTGVVLPRHRAVHVTPTVAKAAAGAIEHLPMAVVPGLPTALTGLRRAGVWTVGLDQGARDSVYDLAVADQPVALVLGAEGSGLSRLTTQRCDALVHVPQYGSLPSLNVSAAGAVACFELARRRAR